MASLYLHIPFCEKKCVYCDFYSIEHLGGMDEFVRALKQEIAMYSSYSPRESFETIFFGGGTPSLLSPKVIGDILGTLHNTFRITANAEVTLETNPGTVDKMKLREYRNVGINRLSFGVQSFHEDELKFLSRIHSADDAEQCVHWAQEVGFDNINVDLIFALPKQTHSRWNENLRRALALNTQHISAYSLIIEEQTPLARMVKAKQVSPLPTELEAEMYESTMEFMGNAGFEHYEVSNFAKPGFRSIHNYNYWNHTGYLGFGPSAHSFWANRRWWNVANLKSYMEKISSEQLPLSGDERLHNEQLINEAIMLGLRSDGINLERLKRTLGTDLVASASTSIQEFVRDGFAILTPTTFRLTDKGFLLCDEICQSLLS